MRIPDTVSLMKNIISLQNDCTSVFIVLQVEFAYGNGKGVELLTRSGPNPLKVIEDLDDVPVSIQLILGSLIGPQSPKKLA
jgi:hypothetical protein